MMKKCLKINQKIVYTWVVVCMFARGSGYFTGHRGNYSTVHLISPFQNDASLII